MKNINNYIFEKFKISKDVKSPSTPKNLDELQALFEEYFWEWVENNEIFPVSKSEKPHMETVYNHIMYTFKENKYKFLKFVRWVLPLNFRKYMNKKYHLNIDEKL